MIIKNIKQAGFLSLDFIMPIFISVTILMIGLIIQSYVREDYVEQKTNYLGFIYHLSLSKGNGIVVYNEKEALKLQQSVISTLDCNNNYCKPLENNLSIGAFISIRYNNGVANDIKVYSSNFGSIFINNNITSSLYSENFSVSPYLISKNPSYVYLLSIQKNITHEYYLEHNLNHFLSKDECIPAGLNCLDVLHYNLSKRITEEECTLAKNQCFDVLFYEKIDQ